DTVARLGGDEFVVVCEGMDEGTTAVVVERIHDAFDVPMLVGSTSLTVSASVGVARSADPDLDAADLLSRADQEMYRAKSRRRHTG
ncbi:MAG: GGDEF domain-containing protein, partial [Acidimicrobiales bacterium]|nr:GGDEF domain-containing protein [Acidimicrobiales bacterium]